MENINNKEALTYLMFKKPMHILVALANGKHKLQLSKECHMTYSHMVKQLTVFGDAGVVKMRRKGRCTDMKMTQYGKELQEIACKFMEKIGEADNGKRDQI